LLALRFSATLWDPDYWADVFARSGAQYVVLTSKHHEGFCNWDSAATVGTTWNWNSVQIGPRRDLVAELAAAIRKPSVVSAQTKKPLKFGLYHSLLEWFNPLYLHDKQHNFTTQSFVDLKTMPELYHIVETYHPEIIWSDGDWESSSDYWKAKEFLAWLATNSSVKDTVVWNDRWGTDATCKHGSYLTCQDHYVPKNVSESKYENCMTLDKGSWGFNRKANVEDYLTTKELVDEVVKTVARNGNILINVGPSADGTISPIMTDRLLGLGDWLAVNGQAIYKSRYWSVCDQDLNFDVFYTRDDDLLYVHLTKWPSDNQVPLVCPQTSEATRAYVLGIGPNSEEEDGDDEEDLHAGRVRILTPGKELSPKHADSNTRGGSASNGHRSSQPSVTLELPNLNPDQVPCQHVWVIVLTAIRNLDDGDSDGIVNRVEFEQQSK
jgi:alpha-L-fucosidase